MLFRSFTKSRKQLLLWTLTIFVNDHLVWSQRLDLNSNSISVPTDLGSNYSSTLLAASQPSPSNSGATATDPLEPGGEIEDPLAPVREQIGTTRSAFGPDRSQTGEDDHWSFELAAEYGYVGDASLSNAQGNVDEQSGILGLLASKRIDEGLWGLSAPTGRSLPLDSTGQCRCRKICRD